MSEHKWTYFSNHLHVIICIARNPEVRVRDISALVGITDRAVMKVISDLREEGVLEAQKVGRRNHYTINLDSKLRHPLERDSCLREILSGLVSRRELRAVAGDS